MKVLVYILMASKGFILNGTNGVSFELTVMTFKGLKFKFDGIEGKLYINSDGIEGIGIRLNGIGGILFNY